MLSYRPGKKMDKKMKDSYFVLQDSRLTWYKDASLGKALDERDMRGLFVSDSCICESIKTFALSLSDRKDKNPVRLCLHADSFEDHAKWLTMLQMATGNYETKAPEPANAGASAGVSTQTPAVEQHVPAKLTRAEKRVQVLDEIIKTERGYVSDLDIVLGSFLTPLRAAVPAAALVRLFSNIESIYALHAPLLDELEALVDRGGLESADVAPLYISRASSLGRYSEYLAANAVHVETLAALCADYPAFAEIVARAEEGPECRSLRLPAFLLAPLQRLTKYPLLFRELKRFSDESAPNYGKLEDLITLYSQAAAAVNKSLLPGGGEAAELFKLDPREVEHQRRLQAVLRLPGNARCADCGAAQPDWVAVSFGTIICVRCAGLHRNFPANFVSRVRCVRTDSFMERQVRLVEAIGNTNASRIYEANMESWVSYPTARDADSTIAAFALDKYCHRKWFDEAAYLDILQRAGVSLQQSDTQSSAAAIRERVGTLFTRPPEAGGAAGDSVLREGWLHKQKYGKWRRRWFVLTASELAYFDDPKRAALGRENGRIALARTVCRAEADAEHGGLPFVFTLRTPERVYILRAESDDERVRWVGALAPAADAAAAASAPEALQLHEVAVDDWPRQETPRAEVTAALSPPDAFGGETVLGFQALSITLQPGTEPTPRVLLLFASFCAVARAVVDPLNADKTLLVQATRHAYSDVLLLNVPDVPGFVCDTLTLMDFESGVTYALHCRSASAKAELSRELTDLVAPVTARLLLDEASERMEVAREAMRVLSHAKPYPSALLVQNGADATLTVSEVSLLALDALLGDSPHEAHASPADNEAIVVQLATELGDLERSTAQAGAALHKIRAKVKLAKKRARRAARTNTVI